MSFFSVHTSHLKQIKTISYGITDDHACGCIRPGTSCYLLTDRTTFKECRHSRLHRSFVVWALLQKSLGRCPKASCHIQHWDSSRMTLQPSVLSVPSLSKLRSSLPLWHIWKKKKNVANRCLHYGWHLMQKSALECNAGRQLTGFGSSPTGCPSNIKASVVQTSSRAEPIWLRKTWPTLATV